MSLANFYIELEQCYCSWFRPCFTSKVPASHLFVYALNEHLPFFCHLYTVYFRRILVKVRPNFPGFLQYVRSLRNAKAYRRLLYVTRKCKFELLCGFTFDIQS